jgi:3-oxoadipate enol-lactonase
LADPTLEPEALLPGRPLTLPGRGRTFLREHAGPPGAPTLILLHGLGATAALNWAGASIALRRHFRIVALDQRGHGRGIRTRHFRLEDCADDVAAVAAHLGIDRAVIVGYSMGGPIASLVWRRHPDLVDGLVLIATTRTFSEHRAEKIGLAVLTGVLVATVPSVPGLAAIGAGFSNFVSRMPVVGHPCRDLAWFAEEMAHHDPRAVLQAAEQLGRFSSQQWIEGVDVPTAVVTTTKDRIVRPERQVRLALTIPSAVLHPTIDGHLGLLGAQTSASSRVVLEACQQVTHRAQTWHKRTGT